MAPLPTSVILICEVFIRQDRDCEKWKPAYGGCLWIGVVSVHSKKRKEKKKRMKGKHPGAADAHDSGQRHPVLKNWKGTFIWIFASLKCAGMCELRCELFWFRTVTAKWCSMEPPGMSDIVARRLVHHGNRWSPCFLYLYLVRLFLSEPHLCAATTPDSQRVSVCGRALR